MKKYFLYIIYILTKISLASFNLNHYGHEDKYPKSYTLALLDKAFVINKTIHADEKNQSFINSFIRSNIDITDKNKISYKKIENPICYTIKLLSPPFLLKSKLITDEFFKEAQESGSNSAGLNNSENSSELIKENDYIYLASMLIFPIKNEENKVLAYLFGKWPSLLNMNSVETLFGLKSLISVRLFSATQDEKKENIKEITTETLRNPNPSNKKIKQQKKLSDISKFGLEPGNVNIERVSIKPVENWGSSLIQGDDFFIFKVKKGKKGVQSISSLDALNEISKEVYDIYNEQPIHKDFEPYIDSFVTEEDLIDKLNTYLKQEWQNLFKTSIYMHWSFWYIIKDIEDYKNILKDIKEKGLDFKIINNQEMNILKFIRCLPINFENKYFWCNRSRWYKISDSRFVLLEKEINDHKITSHDKLFLPSYRYAKILKKKGEDYKELKYNKEAIENMKKSVGSKGDAILLDRALIPLGGEGNKFEFADLLLQKANGKYFFIHVKREKADDFDHQRAQIERCALFLGEHLNRSAIGRALIQSVIDQFYKVNKINDFLNKNSKEKKISRSSVFSQKASTYPVSTFKKNKKKQYSDFIFNTLLKVTLPHRLKLKEILNKKELKILIQDFEPFKNTLFKCLDALDALYRYSKDDDQKNEAITKNFLENVLSRLKKHRALTLSDGLLKKEVRDKITIVMAVIEDKAATKKDEVFHKQKIWGLEETKKTVERQGIKFKWVLIPSSDVKKETASSPAAQDMSKSSSVDAEIKQPNNLSPSKKQPNSKNLIKNLVKTVQEKYKTMDGVLEVTDEILQDEKGTKYLKIILDGSQGDCCFHGLGIKRGEFIKKLATYIKYNEAKIEKNKNIRVSSENTFQILSKLQALLNTANIKDINAFKNHDFENWRKNNLIEEKNFQLKFDSLIKLKSKKFLVSSDWEQINILAEDSVKDLRKKFKSFLDFYPYIEFEQAMCADFHKKIGDNKELTRLEESLISNKLMDKEGNIAKKISLDNLKAEEFDNFNKKYILHRINFSFSNADEKIAILKDFYLNENQWLDPAAILYLNSLLEYKIIIFQKIDKNLKNLGSNKQEHEIDCRYILYNGSNHYDYLHPIIEIDNRAASSLDDFNADNIRETASETFLPSILEEKNESEKSSQSEETEEVQEYSGYLSEEFKLNNTNREEESEEREGYEGHINSEGNYVYTDDEESEE